MRPPLFSLFLSRFSSPFFPLLHSVLSFPLDLVQKVIVTLVEVVDTNVAVLSTAGVALASGVGGDGVEGTEVASDTANLVLEDAVVEASLELTLTGRGAGDIHGGLTTTEDDKVLLGGDGSAVEGCVARVVFQDGEVLGGDELWREIFVSLFSLALFKT